ncbi:hypothetical protein Cgig2_008316 [Carnegiea gigantea]|uniref:Uncharacterized protein n=1 Tax=Carnegiea gigantea TaxID=171969 RepID=A0A9Q1JTW4_9CARY|nr:hypothetical protein Cgig2_008316 [Carnegiea gigantea]
MSSVPALLKADEMAKEKGKAKQEKMLDLNRDAQAELMKATTTIDDYDATNVGDADKDDASTEGYDESGDSDIEDHNRIALYHWVTKTLLTDFKANPTIDFKAMQKILMERYDLDISIHTCQRAKKRLKEWIEGNHEESYARLPDYIKWLRYSQKVSEDSVMCTTIEILTKIMQHLTLRSVVCCDYVNYYRCKTCTCCSGQLVMLAQSLSTSKLWKLFGRNQKRIMSGYLMNQLGTELVKAEKESKACRLTPTGRGIFERLPQNSTTPIDIERGRPQIERRRDITKRRKQFSRSITLKCKYYKQFGHNKRSQRDVTKLQREKRKNEGWKAYERRTSSKEIKDVPPTFLFKGSFAAFLLKQINPTFLLKQINPGFLLEEIKCSFFL